MKKLALKKRTKNRLKPLKKAKKFIIYRLEENIFSFSSFAIGRKMVLRRAPGSNFPKHKNIFFLHVLPVASTLLPWQRTVLSINLLRRCLQTDLVTCMHSMIHAIDFIVESAFARMSFFHPHNKYGRSELCVENIYFNLAV